MSKKIKISLIGLCSLGLFFFAVIFPALNEAHASVFSFISNALAAKDGSKEASAGSKYNSQNISLLQAPVSGSKVATGGGDITIVDSSALEFQVETTGEHRPVDQISTYVVHDGDTLSQIAVMFNVSVNTIVWANDIKNGVISPGQNLVILPVSGVEHIVKKGDTLKSIAKKYNGNLEEITQFNSLETDAQLAVGDKIIIPNGDATPVKGSTVSTVKTVASGYYVRPISGGRRTQGIHGYNGVDLAAPVGTKIVASAAGKVIVSRSSGYNGGYGNYVVVSHPNGTQTLYAHMSETAVVVGAQVAQGQVIGYVGNTGRSTGPHVHFEIRGAKNPF